MSWSRSWIGNAAKIKKLAMEEDFADFSTAEAGAGKKAMQAVVDKIGKILADNHGVQYVEVSASGSGPRSTSVSVRRIDLIL